jgi:hypothetical protein
VWVQEKEGGKKERKKKNHEGKRLEVYTEEGHVTQSLPTFASRSASLQPAPRAIE